MYQPCNYNRQQNSDSSCCHYRAGRNNNRHLCKIRLCSHHHTRIEPFRSLEELLGKIQYQGNKNPLKKMYTNRIRLLTSAVKQSVALRVIEVVPTVTIAGTSFRVIFALCCVIAMKVLYTVVVTVFTEHKTITYTLWYTNFSIVVIQVMFPGWKKLLPDNKKTKNISSKT